MSMTCKRCVTAVTPTVTPPHAPVTAGHGLAQPCGHAPVTVVTLRGQNAATPYRGARDPNRDPYEQLSLDAQIAADHDDKLAALANNTNPDPR